MLLDHKMGGMTGIEVLEELIRQQRARAHCHDYRLRDAGEPPSARPSPGAFDFLAKPFTPKS